MQEVFPLITVLGPAADLLDAGQGRGRHSIAEAGLVGDALHAVDEAVEIADRQDESFDVVGEEILRAGGRGGDDGAATGKSLSLDEG